MSLMTDATYSPLWLMLLIPLYDWCYSFPLMTNANHVPLCLPLLMSLYDWYLLIMFHWCYSCTFCIMLLMSISVYHKFMSHFGSHYSCQIISDTTQPPFCQILLSSLSAWYYPFFILPDTTQPPFCLILPNLLSAWYYPTSLLPHTTQSPFCVILPNLPSSWY